MQNAATPSPRPHLFRRGPTYLLYGASVLALSLATFGVVRFLPGILVSAFWLTVYCSRHRPTALLYASTAVVAVCGLACCLIPAMAATNEPARRAECRAKLRNLGLALHNYHDVYGSFPPAYTTDETGRRLHSWRVLLLPFVDQAPLYDRIDLREPWDRPRNREVLHRMPQVFACPMKSIGDNCTSYLAVAGDGGVWPGSGTTSIPEIHDGPEQTIVVVECLSEIHWAEPRDLELDEAARQLESSEARDIHGKWHWKDTVLYEYLHGGHVLFADGEVRFAPGGTDQATWRGLLTIDDALPGQDWDRIAATSFRVRRLRIGNCLRLAAFVVLALLPLRWVWDDRMAGRI